MNRFAVLIQFVFFVLASIGTPTVATAAPKGVVVQKPQVDMPLSENARKHFKAGIAYVDDPSGPKWEEAYREFLAAYADTPTWRLQNNIGLCALNLERDGEAIAAYTAYLQGGGEPDLKPKDRKQIETDIATMTASLVKVEIEFEPTGVTVIDERKNTKGALVINNYQVTGGKASLGIHPGRHKITVEAAGFVSEEWVIDASPASTHAHVFTLVRKSGIGNNAVPAATTLNSTDHQPSNAGGPTGADSSGSVRATTNRHTLTSVYVAGAAAGVLAVAATVTGVVTLSKQSDYKSARDAAEADRLANSGRTWALVTDIEIGAALLSAGAAAYLYFTAPRETQVAAELRPRAAGKALESSSCSQLKALESSSRSQLKALESSPRSQLRVASTPSNAKLRSSTSVSLTDPRSIPQWQFAPTINRNAAGLSIIGTF